MGKKLTGPTCFVCLSVGANQFQRHHAVLGLGFWPRASGVHAQSTRGGSLLDSRNVDSL